MDHAARILIELGSVAVGLALLARLAIRMGFSAIPLYLLAGLAFGNGGLVPLELSRGFIQMGAQMGVLLLLFLLGLEYTGEELRDSLKQAVPAGAVDFVLNFTPGLLTGWLLGWSPLAIMLLGGITYISSSGIAAKVLTDLKRLNHPETPSVFAVLMMEDLAMAVFLPLCAVLLIGGGAAKVALSVGVATVTATLILFVAVRYGRQISEFAAHESDEVILLTTFGSVLLVAGVAESLQVSAAIGAFLAGIALSGPIAAQSRRLLAPLRDLFAAMFFFFFGLQIAPASLPPASASGDRLGTRNGGHQDPHRILGGAAGGRGPSGRHPRRHGARRARGVLHRPRREWASGWSRNWARWRRPTFSPLPCWAPWSRGRANSSPPGVSGCSIQSGGERTHGDCLSGLAPLC